VYTTFTAFEAGKFLKENQNFWNKKLKKLLTKI